MTQFSLSFSKWFGFPLEFWMESIALERGFIVQILLNLFNNILISRIFWLPSWWQMSTGAQSIWKKSSSVEVCLGQIIRKTLLCWWDWSMEIQWKIHRMVSYYVFPRWYTFCSFYSTPVAERSWTTEVCWFNVAETLFSRKNYEVLFLVKKL